MEERILEALLTQIGKLNLLIERLAEKIDAQGERFEEVLEEIAEERRRAESQWDEDDYE